MRWIARARENEGGHAGDGLVAVDHFDGAAFFAMSPHGAATIRTGRAGHAKFRNLVAVLAARGSERQLSLTRVATSIEQ